MSVWPNAVPIAEPDGHAVPCSTGPGNKSELVLGKMAARDGLDDGTPLLALSGITDPAFLLVGNSTSDFARKLIPTGWGLSNLLASVPAGRVPFSHADGTVTSDAGLTYDATTNGLTVQTNLRMSHDGTNAIIRPLTGSLRLQDAFGTVTVSQGSITATNLTCANFGAYSYGGEVAAGKQLVFTAGSLGFGTATAGLALDSAGVLRVTNGSTGVGGLITGPLTVRNVAGSYDAFTAAIDGAVKTRGEYQNWNGSTVYNRLAYTGLFINANTSAIRFVPGDPSALSPDAEVARSSAGFVGLGSSTNKVVVGHNATDGFVSSKAGYLRLAGTRVICQSDTTGVPTILQCGTFIVRTTGGSCFEVSEGLSASLANNMGVEWSATDDAGSPKDTRIRRSAAGTLDIDNGTAGQYRDLRLRTLLMTNGSQIYDDPTYGMYLQPATGKAEWLGQLTVNNNSTGGDGTKVPVKIRGNGSQTANLTEWQTSTPTTVASVSAAGLGTFAGLTVRQSGGVAGTDELQISHDGTNGTVRSMDGSVILRAASTNFSFQRGSDGYELGYLNNGFFYAIQGINTDGASRALEFRGSANPNPPGLFGATAAVWTFGTNGSATTPSTFSSVPLAVSVSADTDNWSPGTAMYIDLTTDGTDRHVTGLVAGVDGQTVYVRHVAGAGNLILDHESASSVATNRFDAEGAADITVPLRGSVMLTYSTVISRWRTFPSKSCT